MPGNKRGIMLSLAERDLNHVLDHTRDFWEEMRGERIFITGGTGFFGCWLLESFLWANTQLKLGAKATVLSRSPLAFLERMPHLQNRQELKWVQGDVSDFTFPSGNYPFVIHAATEASAKLTKENPRKMFDTIVDGTQHTIEFSQTHGTGKFLLTSSGAVYGKQPSEMICVPETYFGGPSLLDPSSIYGEGKRIAELLCSISSPTKKSEMKIARCFAFVGPHLPLDAHFAIGNFIRDGIKGGPIVIQGDGTPQRSYLYASDLAIWLWTILFKGRHLHPYNVGSDEGISISDLAQVVSRQFQPPTVITTLGKQDCNKPIERYIPDITCAKEELNLDVRIPLEKGIQYTIENYQQHFSICKLG